MNTTKTMTPAPQLKAGDRFFSSVKDQEVTIKSTKRIRHYGTPLIRVECEGGYITDFSYGSSVSIIGQH